MNFTRLSSGQKAEKKRRQRRRELGDFLPCFLKSQRFTGEKSEIGPQRFPQGHQPVSWRRNQNTRDSEPRVPAAQAWFCHNLGKPARALGALLSRLAGSVTQVSSSAVHETSQGPQEEEVGSPAPGTLCWQEGTGAPLMTQPSGCLSP